MNEKPIKLKAIIVCKTCGRIASDPDDEFGGVHCSEHPMSDLEIVYKGTKEELDDFKETETFKKFNESQLGLFEKMED